CWNTGAQIVRRGLGLPHPLCQRFAQGLAVMDNEQSHLFFTCPTGAELLTALPPSLTVEALGAYVRAKEPIWAEVAADKFGARGLWSLWSALVPSKEEGSGRDSTLNAAINRDLETREVILLALAGRSEHAIARKPWGRELLLRMRVRQYHDAGRRADPEADSAARWRTAQRRELKMRVEFHDMFENQGPSVKRVFLPEDAIETPVVRSSLAGERERKRAAAKKEMSSKREREAETEGEGEVVERKAKRKPEEVAETETETETVPESVKKTKKPKKSKKSKTEGEGEGEGEKKKKKKSKKDKKSKRKEEDS
ncbi:hypothetical protein KIPB_002898, partial [Kipferlia bialata]